MNGPFWTIALVRCIYLFFVMSVTDDYSYFPSLVFFETGFCRIWICSLNSGLPRAVAFWYQNIAYILTPYFIRLFGLCEDLQTHFTIPLNKSSVKMGVQNIILLLSLWVGICSLVYVNYKKLHSIYISWFQQRYNARTPTRY